jgi:nucleoid-associated protein YgaU
MKASLGIAGVDTSTLTTVQAIYTVQQGDFLTGIAFDFYQDSDRWTDILSANNIPVEDADLIAPGTVLVIPQ